MADATSNGPAQPRREEFKGREHLSAARKPGAKWSRQSGSPLLQGQRILEALPHEVGFRIDMSETIRPVDHELPDSEQ